MCFQDLTVENVANVYDLAEAYHALSLRHTCVLFILEQHKQMSSMIGLFSATDRAFFHLFGYVIPIVNSIFMSSLRYPALIQRIIPEIRDYLQRILRPQPCVRNHP